MTDRLLRQDPSIAPHRGFTDPVVFGEANEPHAADRQKTPDKNGKAFDDFRKRADHKGFQFFERFIQDV